VCNENDRTPTTDRGLVRSRRTSRSTNDRIRTIYITDYVISSSYVRIRSCIVLMSFVGGSELVFYLVLFFVFVSLEIILVTYGNCTRVHYVSNEIHREIK